MPRIIVTDDASDLVNDPRTTLAERVNLHDLDSRHFSEHLLQRVRWALSDLQEARPAPRRRPAAAGDRQRSASVVTTAS